MIFVFLHKQASLTKCLNRDIIHKNPSTTKQFTTKNDLQTKNIKKKMILNKLEMRNSWK